MSLYVHSNVVVVPVGVVLVFTARHTVSRQRGIRLTMRKGRHQVRSTENLVGLDKTECVIANGCPLQSRETARLESAWCTGVEIKPSNPEDMDKFGFCVILALEVVSRRPRRGKFR